MLSLYLSVTHYVSVGGSVSLIGCCASGQPGKHAQIGHVEFHPDCTATVSEALFRGFGELSQDASGVPVTMSVTWTPKGKLLQYKVIKGGQSFEAGNKKFVTFDDLQTYATHTKGSPGLRVHGGSLLIELLSGPCVEWMPIECPFYDDGVGDVMDYIPMRRGPLQGAFTFAFTDDWGNPFVPLKTEPAMYLEICHGRSKGVTTHMDAKVDFNQHSLAPVDREALLCLCFRRCCSL